MVAQPGPCVLRQANKGHAYSIIQDLRSKGHTRRISEPVKCFACTVLWNILLLALQRTRLHCVLLACKDALCSLSMQGLGWPLVISAPSPPTFLAPLLTSGCLASLLVSFALTVPWVSATSCLLIRLSSSVPSLGSLFSCPQGWIQLGSLSLFLTKSSLLRAALYPPWEQRPIWLGSISLIW